MLLVILKVVETFSSTKDDIIYVTKGNVFGGSLSETLVKRTKRMLVIYLITYIHIAQSTRKLTLLEVSFFTNQVLNMLLYINFFLRTFHPQRFYVCNVKVVFSIAEVDDVTKEIKEANIFYHTLSVTAQ